MKCNPNLRIYPNAPNNELGWAFSDNVLRSKTLRFSDAFILLRFNQKSEESRFLPVVYFIFFY